MRRKNKMTNDKVTKEMLDARTKYAIAGDFGKPKYIEFCEYFLEKVFLLEIYEARETVSKYITVIGQGNKRFKVRFSNHAPAYARELAGDCNFFVGRTHLGITNYRQAIESVNIYFNKESANAN